MDDLTPQAQSSLQEHLLFERILKYFEQRPMRVRRECKMQNWAHLIIYQKCPFNGQLSLVGYAQSSAPGELKHSSVRQKILHPSL